MNKQLLIFVLACLIIIGCSLKVRSQGLQEFAKPEKRQCDNSFYSSFGATTSDGVIVVYSAVKGLVFTILQGADFLIDTIHDEKNDRYVLIVKPTGGEYLYYTIRVKAPGYDYKQFTTEEILAGGKPSSCWMLNPKTNTVKTQIEYVAHITVYGKDGKPLEGAKLTNKKTGKSELTNSEGIGRIRFEIEDQVANITISHSSYSDTKNIIVRDGDHQKHTLYQYNPSGALTKRNWKFKPEKFTMEIELIGGTNCGFALDFTASYFLVGFGIDWMIITHEQTTTTNLINSGFTGNFTKVSTMNLSGNRMNLFIDLGLYFKYFSVSCQIGQLKTTINRTAIYDGWGYGLIDEEMDINEYWGSYVQQSFTKSAENNESYVTLMPQIKGYIPVGKNKATSISVGLGYTFIPTLNYYSGLSGSLGIHFRL